VLFLRELCKVMFKVLDSLMIAAERIPLSVLAP